MFNCAAGIPFSIFQPPPPIPWRFRRAIVATAFEPGRRASGLSCRLSLLWKRPTLWAESSISSSHKNNKENKEPESAERRRRCALLPTAQHWPGLIFTALLLAPLLFWLAFFWGLANTHTKYGLQTHSTPHTPGAKQRLKRMFFCCNFVALFFCISLKS